MAADTGSSPATPPTGGGAPTGGWRLPVRIRVPERDELLAMALATLAVGLVLGLAVGPGLGNAGRILPIISAPFAQVPISPGINGGDSQQDTLPVLSAPAGSDAGETPIPAVPDTDTDTVAIVAAAPDVPTEPTPEDPSTNTSQVPPVPQEPAPEPELEGLPLTGTVLASSVNGKSFSLADRSGNLQTVFSDFPPEPGERISTTVLPLVNGTFSEYGGRLTLANRDRATVRGMVSFTDPELNVLVLSNRGTSLPLDGSAVSEELLPPLDPSDPDAELPLEGGDWVEVRLALVDLEAQQSSASRWANIAASGTGDPAEDPGTDPEQSAEAPELGLQIESLERLDETATRIEITGKLLELNRRQGTLLISADSLGLLDRAIEISTPSGFDFAGVKAGRVYCATVRRTVAGDFRLTGFSSGYSGRVADDRSEVFGEQGY